MNKDELLKKAVDTWGKAKQMVMVLEETAELQKEVCKILRGDYSASRMDSLASEIADCRLMCDQLEIMFSLSSKVAIEQEVKLARLSKRLLLAMPVEERRPILEQKVKEYLR